MDKWLEISLKHMAEDDFVSAADGQRRGGGGVGGGCMRDRERERERGRERG